MFSDIYRSTKDELDGKVVCYNDYFSKYRSQIEDALSDAFELDARSLYNDLTGKYHTESDLPQILKERRFDVFCKSSEKAHSVCRFMRSSTISGFMFERSFRRQLRRIRKCLR